MKYYFFSQGMKNIQLSSKQPRDEKLRETKYTYAYVLVDGKWTEFTEIRNDNPCSISNWEDVETVASGNNLQVRYEDEPLQDVYQTSKDVRVVQRISFNELQTT